MRVENKPAMKKMLARGDFGNTMRTWATIDDIVASGYDGCIYVRTDLASDSQRRMFEIPLESLTQTLASLKVPHEECQFYEAPPNKLRKLQGEICDTQFGLALFYTWTQAPLTTALNIDGRQVWRLIARHVLEEALRPDSLDNLYELLNLYECATIEFTEFSRPIGTLGRHLCIWEVRNY